ncbi:MAG: SGNH/GDSL hydrolase family protein, partial [Candidatus Methylomirabilis sp.]|nr:SGNH/GDSL hydrolase family protein [Deltaproteobacteria bacterium]
MRTVNRRNLLWGALALGGSLALALALAEAVVRAAWGDLMPTHVIKKYLVEPDPVLDWRLRPNVDLAFESREFGAVRFESNARGLRAGRDIPYEKPAGERRLLALGDSFTYGQWVNLEDTYAERIAALLPGWETVNTGVFGYDTDRELYVLETEGLRYAPDVVIQF